MLQDLRTRATSQPETAPLNEQTSQLVGNWQSAAPVPQRSRVRIPYKPELFSSFLFAAAKVASITAMTFCHIILDPVVLIYDFHIFITSLSFLLNGKKKFSSATQFEGPY